MNLDILQHTAHRPWALPDRKWLMYQEWNDLLFIHYKIDYQQLRARIPEELEIDSFQDEFYIGVVPFWMSAIKFRGLPELPGFNSFPELNLRTYVHPKGNPNRKGVYFFTLEATNLAAVLGARISYQLPYSFARMSCKTEANKTHYESSRIAPQADVRFIADYQTLTENLIEPKSDIETWLSERYCLYVVKNKKLLSCEIHHLPWPLQKAKLSIQTNTVAEGMNFKIAQQEPLVHFSKKLEVFIWSLKDV